jgi:bla regulator protein BlaR1
VNCIKAQKEHFKTCRLSIGVRTVAIRLWERQSVELLASMLHQNQASMERKKFEPEGFSIESPLACVSGICESNLKKRVVRIMMRRLTDKLSLEKRVLLGISAIAVIATRLIYGAVSAPVVLTEAPQIRAQARPEDGTATLPSFEVVSVKPYPPKYWPTSSYMEFTAVGFNWRNTIAQALLVYAYDLRDPRLSNRQRLIPGGEKWMFWDWFDVQARMSEENIAVLRRISPSEQEVYKRQLVQSILMDRFKLKVHHVTREGPALELVVAKHGPKNMKRVPDNAEGKPNFPDLNHARFEAAPIDMLVDLVRALENVPVLDKTGLTGKYDFKLEFSRDPDTPMLPGGKSLPPTNDSEPTIFDALQGQLGLKLVRIKLPMDEIVIDHIEKPSEN